MATDGQVPLLAGYPVAVLSSMDWYKAPSNYHWPTDRPENLDTDSVAAALTLAEAFVRKLDRDAAGSPDSAQDPGESVAPASPRR
jgi:hypothetical protein